MAPLFHLSIPVNDLDRAKIYLSTLGCEIGRETKGRFDINFFGHHVVAHLSPKDAGMDGGTIPRMVRPRRFAISVLSWSLRNGTG